ncbi:MAG TPA: nucleoside triphosphate pyrophosphohydrolase, partial [Mycobacterium sp.]|nr:nucleoside triphosphate pyrophosphohydrolase [Mycobacterium sp.]
TIDDVADALVRKLGNRVPGVLAGKEISLDEQLAQWKERKASEKSRNSVLDDVPTAQPALALAQKVIQRVHNAGLPADLIPESITSITVTADSDAENALRSAVLEFMDTVRDTEKAIAACRRGDDIPEELDVTPLGVVTEEEWRAYWPPVPGEPIIEESAEELTASPDEPAAEPAGAVEVESDEAAEPEAEASTDQSATEDEQPAADPPQPAAVAVEEAVGDGQGDQSGTEPQ